MCGIIGLIGHQDVVHDLYRGMFSLQHRGQDAAGILTYSNDSPHLKKRTGLVGDIFDEFDFQKLKGNMGIGHTRYPTAGTGTSEDAQPFFVNHPGMAMVHNGNIVNCEEIKHNLKIYNHRLTSATCDVEAILNLFAQVLVEKLTMRKMTTSQAAAKITPTDMFEALEIVMSEANGAYSVIAAIANHGLIAFKDPNGIRPLTMAIREDRQATLSGTQNNTYGFASESVALTTIGMKIIRELQPGEVVYIDKDFNVHSKIIKSHGQRSCMFEWVYFARPDSEINNLPVYDARMKLGENLAKDFAKTGIKLDVVMPIPDSSRTAAVSFARELGLHYEEGFIKNRYITRTFIQPSQEKRTNSVKVKLNPIESQFKGKVVGLVDDSLVRGTTAKTIIQLARNAGAKEVHFILTCPPITHRCFYGIDMSTKKELIARNMTLDEMTKALNADSIFYQTIEGLREALSGQGLCTGCLTGEYPTILNDETKERWANARINVRGENIALEKNPSSDR